MKTSRSLVWRYALPAISENILQTTVGFADGLLVAQVSLVAVSAVGLVNGIIAVYQAVIIALSTAVTTLVAKHLGQKEEQKAQQMAQVSWQLAILLSLALLLVSLMISKPLLLALGARGLLLDNSHLFFVWQALSMPLLVLIPVLSSLLRVEGQVTQVLYANIFINVLNVLLDSLLIFGWFGLPRLGLVGIALGSFLSRVLGLIWLFNRVQASSLRLSWGFINKLDDSLILLKRLLPIAGERLLMRIGDLLVFALIMGYGAAVFAGNSIGETIMAYNYLPMFGFATAVSVLASRSYGEGDGQAVKRLTWSAYKGALCLSGILAILVLVGSEPLGRLFTHDMAVMGAIKLVLAYSAVGVPITVGVLIYAAALQAMGDVVTPFWATGLGMWLCRIVGGYVLGTWLGMGLFGVWLAVILDNTLRLIVLKWKYEYRIKT